MVTKMNDRLHALLHLELKSCYRHYRPLRLELTRRPRARPTTGRKALWMCLARLAQAYNQIHSQMSPR